MAELPPAELDRLYREVAASMAQLPPWAHSSPERCTRRLMLLAESQTPGAELRSLYITAAAVALLGAAGCSARDATRRGQAPPPRSSRAMEGVPGEIRCACCGAAAPAAGWHSFAVVDGIIDEAYCSAACFVAHQDGTCACFIGDAEFDEPLGDEPWL